MNYNKTPPQYNFDSQKAYENFIELLAQLKEKIFKSLENIIPKNEDKLDCLIKDLKESFESVSVNLKKIKDFEEEYYDFFSIKRITFYILDNREFLELSSVKTLINSFYKLIQLKIKLDHNKYLEKYNEFNLELLKYEQFFYTEICQASENYDEDTLSKITNGLIKI